MKSAIFSVCFISLSVVAMEQQTLRKSALSRSLSPEREGAHSPGVGHYDFKKDCYLYCKKQAELILTQASLDTTELSYPSSYKQIEEILSKKLKDKHLEIEMATIQASLIEIALKINKVKLLEAEIQNALQLRAQKIKECSLQVKKQAELILTNAHTTCDTQELDGSSLYQQIENVLYKKLDEKQHQQIQGTESNNEKNTQATIEIALKINKVHHLEAEIEDALKCRAQKVTDFYG